MKQNQKLHNIQGPCGGLKGILEVPGDKSISHRSLMLGAIASGTTRITGLLEGEDCMATLQAIRQLGAVVEKEAPGAYTVQGVGGAGLREPEDVLDMGNSGTATRLLLGLLAGYPLAATLTGDSSIRRRPMLRVVDPLRQMGTAILGRQDGAMAPLTIQGGGLQAIDYQSPIASAQVKSAVLLAGLHAEGSTSVTEPSLSRDHSERMLEGFGARIHKDGLRVTVEGGSVLQGRPVHVPGDFSSAAFFIVAALLVPGSRLEIKKIGLNPTRTGLLEVLQSMGGKIQVLRQEESAGELIGDLLVESSVLQAVTIAGEMVPRMIDEFPVFTLAAACAEGRSEVRQAKELRYKESDRIASIARQMLRLGIHVEQQEDGYTVEGGQKPKAAAASSEGDHRIAMTLAVAGLLAEGTTTVEDTGCVATSFPNFFQLLNQCGGETQ